MSQETDEIQKVVEETATWVPRLREEIRKVIVGQEYLIDRLIVGILANGHVLLEGVPGLAKTLSVRTLATAIKADFSRIQFTPDLLPADVVGTLIYNPRTSEFQTRKGPIFANVVLADEINRAPAKVQSALLEAMQERQVTLGDETHFLPKPFLVLATENPIDQEGTYPLPEAQVDRFMLKLRVDYPSKKEELRILQEMATTKPKTDVDPVIDLNEILKARETVDQIYVDPKIQQYAVDLVFATRKPSDYGLDMDHFIQFGGSPRATISLILAAKAWAFLQGRGYVTPHDIKTIGMDVLRHRVIPSYEAEAEGYASEQIINRIFDTVAVP
ncbi:AAA family ATPase [Puniceicoccus vermicola]|uniref:MoxR family ATPase n=1 Tax=Puniceicoccus vermicola TaxID=388746 RepID=A0A7X1B1G3_9BACT|nr:MoxR family ATPase [Puniceicoccus vermicola]MBC2603714.1 MoxR family ATPase [Puniceicoccus vermicola]